MAEALLCESTTFTIALRLHGNHVVRIRRAAAATRVMLCELQDYDELHAGVEQLRKNTNPFTGGINFDEPRQDLGLMRLAVVLRCQLGRLSERPPDRLAPSA